MVRRSSTRLNLIFLFCFLLISFLYNYQKILFHRPYSNHVWRQADCLSITMNYYKENLSFFTPEVHWIGDKGNGKTISEFPIIYFTVAQLWKIIGQEEFIFRLINMLIVFLGLFYLRKLSYEILNDSFWSLFIPLFLFTSPLLIFYTCNFLPNAPALGLVLTGSYYYYLFDKHKTRKNMILSMSFFLFAGLLKLTSLIIFTAIFSAILLNGIYWIIKRKYSAKLLFYRILPFITVTFIITIWYLYAHFYNKHNHRGIFLQEIFPIWELSVEKRKETFELFYRNLIPSFFNKQTLLGISIIFLFSLSTSKKKNLKLTSILVITFIGIIIYFLLFFRAFHVHDYYLTNLLVFIPLLLLTFLYYLKFNHNKIFKSILTKSLFTILLLVLVTQGALKNRLKYNSKKYSELSNVFIKKSERDYWDYYHWSYKNNFKAFETITPYLRELGLTRYDKILSFSDGSINHSLYLMDQKGLTKFGYGILNDNERVEFAIKQDCKYLIVSEHDLSKLEIDYNYLQKQIGKYQNILIFKLT